MVTSEGWNKIEIEKAIWFISSFFCLILENEEKWAQPMFVGRVQQSHAT